MTIYLYFRCSNFAPSAAIRIWILVWISHCTRWSIEGDMLAQAPVMRRLRSYNVCGGFAYTCCFGNPTEKRPEESDQTNVEAILRNCHTQIFGPRITWRDTASLEMLWEQVLRHVKTIRSWDKTLEGSPKNWALHTAAVVNTMHLLRYHSKIIDWSTYYCKLHTKY